MLFKWKQLILLNLAGLWNVKEVIVLGSENLAGNKPTRQINNHNDRNESHKAVDGNHRTSVDQCTHTKNPTSVPNWFVVDLEAEYEIKSVTLLNRGDCCAARLSNFTLSVWHYDPGPHIKYNMTDNEFCVCATRLEMLKLGELKNIPCTKICFGRFVLLISNNPDSLSLCEIQAFGNLTSGCSTLYLSESYIKKMEGKRSSPPNCPPSPHQVSNIHECIHQCLQMINCISFNYSPQLINNENCELVTCFSHPWKDFTADSNWNWIYISHY